MKAWGDKQMMQLYEERLRSADISADRDRLTAELERMTALLD